MHFSSFKLLIAIISISSFGSAQTDNLKLQLEKYLQLEQQEDVVNTYVRLVRLNRVQDPKLAIQYAFEGIDYFGNNKSFLLELGHLYAGLGNTLEAQGFVEKSLKYHSKAINIYSQINAVSHIGWRQMDIGTVYYNQKMYEAASNRYAIALDLFASISDLHGMAVIENNLGLIKQKQNLPREAILHYEKALVYRNEIGNQNLIGHSISYLGKANAQLNRYDKALELFEKANSILSNGDEPKIVLDNFESMANLYRQLGEFDLAVQFYNKANLIAEENHFLIRIPAIKIALGQIYIRLKNYELALNNLDEGLKASKKTQSLTNQSAIYRELHSVYLKKNNIEKSLIMLNNYTTIQDSIQARGYAEALTKIEVTRVISENEQALNEKIREIKEQKVYRNMMGLGFIFSIILLGGLIHRYLYMKRTSRELQNQQKIIHEKEIAIQKEKGNRLKNDLDFKHKQLTQKALNMSHTQEILLNLTLQLKQIENGSSTAVKKSLGLIQEQLHSENEWQEFEKWFSEVHNDFFDTLKLQFPALSQREQKICALLKLKLSTKDIARLINLSPGSVEQYRIKIRKKLNLERSVNLTEFIDSI